MFLLSPEILAFACFAQAEQIAIKMQTSVRVRDPDGSVVDAEKKVVVFLLPTRIAFAGWKINDLQIVLVGITKVERFDSRSGLDRRRQSLRTCRDELHFQSAQFFKCLIHLAHNYGDVLKPKIVASRVSRNRSARRG